MYQEQTIKLPDDTYKVILEEGASIFLGHGDTEEEARKKAIYMFELSKIPTRGRGQWE